MKLGFYHPYQLLIYFVIFILHYVIHSCPSPTTTSPPHVSLYLLCHYSIIRMKTNHYITPLLRLRPRNISVCFSRQSNGRNSGSIQVFLMELFTWSWSSLYDFISTFPSPFFEWLTPPFNKVLEFVSSLPRVELSQTSFGHISINSPSILTVSMATESPWKDLSIGTSHVSRRSIMTEILGRSTGNHYGTVY